MRVRFPPQANIKTLVQKWENRLVSHTRLTISPYLITHRHEILCFGGISIYINGLMPSKYSQHCIANSVPQKPLLFSNICRWFTVWLPRVKIGIITTHTITSKGHCRAGHGTGMNRSSISTFYTEVSLVHK